MKSKVQIHDDQVFFDLGPARLTIPDDPFWWAVMRRTVEAIVELGAGDRDDGRG